MKKMFFLAALLFIYLININAVFADTLYFISSPQFTGTVGVKYTYTPKTIDSADQNVSYSLTKSPSWLSISGGILSGTPTTSGRVEIDILAKDSAGNTATQAYFVNISAPVIATKPAPTQVLTPTPTATIIPTVSTPVIVSPTSTPASKGQNTASLISTLPQNDASTTSTSILLQAVIKSSFALDKQNIQFFFDSVDKTSDSSLTTKTNPDGSYQSDISYLANNLSIAKHDARIVIISPDSSTIPFSWSFTVIKTQTSTFQNLQNSIKSAFEHAWFPIIILLALLIIAFIIFFSVLRRGKKLSEEKKKQDQETTSQ